MQKKKRVGKGVGAGLGTARGPGMGAGAGVGGGRAGGSGGSLLCRRCTWCTLMPSVLLMSAWRSSTPVGWPCSASSWRYGPHTQAPHPPTLPQPLTDPHTLLQVGDDPHPAYDNILRHLGSVRYAGEEREGETPNPHPSTPQLLPPHRADSGHPFLQHPGPAAHAPRPLLPLQWVPDHPTLLPERPLDPLPAARPHQPGPGRTRSGGSPSGLANTPPVLSPSLSSWSSSREAFTPRRRPSRRSPSSWWTISEPRRS